MMKRILIAVAAGLVFWGCEKKIDMDLDTEEPRLVVEASIENNQPPLVILTRSTGYFSEIDAQMLEQLYVHNADVFISNGTLTHKLKEYAIPVAPGVNGYFYSIDSASLNTAFVGELNTSYNLRIVSEGNEYNASTTITGINKQIDSLWWKQAPGSDDSAKVIIMVKATDPPGYGDYMRYYTRINSQQLFYPPAFSVYDDLFIDGTTYEVQVQPGINRNMDRDSIEYDFFSRGDTVNFKVSSINRDTYDFWRTWESAYSSIGNPFSSPVRVMGNISNGALGAFSGYASQYHSIIIPQ